MPEMLAHLKRCPERGPKQHFSCFDDSGDNYGDDVRGGDGDGGHRG